MNGAAVEAFLIWRDRGVGGGSFFALRKAAAAGMLLIMGPAPRANHDLTPKMPAPVPSR
ncbi:MAG: hypothetical protein ABSH56_28905 [Bryobacteraceae bacterium]